ncbi:hypothetical protein ACFSSC_08865 [Corynebacterium mendelii]|uniref:CGL2689-like C-terminal domain-containing protein n=1 Tax=Corynebacterium mendelii TaxID=2765362 RepID=A0A939E3T5_9CORY|nr:hypothetical protein [Corynebacterium mendelii]MBN9645087.1 hypothetical protein [Corynebacterium mendelii]
MTDSPSGEILAGRLVQAGHVVTGITRIPPSPVPGGSSGSPDETVLASELLLIDLHRDNLLAFAGHFTPAASNRIIIHTCASVGVAPLAAAGDQRIIAAATPLAVLDAAHPDNLDGCFWAVTAHGLRNKAVTEVFIEDLQGRVLDVPDSMRPGLAAALAQATGHTATVISDAVNQLTSAVGEREFAVAALRHLLAQTVQAGLEPPAARRQHNQQPACGYTAGLGDPDEAALAHAAVTDPSAAEAFMHLIRRTAQTTGALDVELWTHTAGS